MKTNFFTASLRYFVTLTLLIIGAKGAVAQTTITDLSNLSDDKVYMLSVPHGLSLTAASFGASFQLKATDRNTPSTIFDIERFALLKSPTKNGVYYLFNIFSSVQKFVPVSSTDNSVRDPILLDTPNGGFRIEANTTGAQKTDFPWVFKANKTGNFTVINVGSDKHVTIDSNGNGSTGSLDNGNQFKITEAGTIPSEMKKAALQKIYTLEGYTGPIVEEGYIYTIAGGIDKDYKYLSAHLSKAGTDGQVTTPGMVVRKQETDDLLSRLWRFELDGTGFKIISANFNRGISGTPQDASNKRGLKLAASDAEASVFTYDTEGVSGYIRLTCGDYKYLNVSTAGGADQDFTVGGVSGRHIGYWDDNGNNKAAGDNQWKFTKVTSIPVTIQATAEYASVGYPFAVQVPEGVTAYYATSTANNILTLEEITSKVIPANQGALLYKQGGGEVSLTIVPNSTETLTNENLLIAATARREGYTAGSTYMLALSPSTNKAAFLKSNLTVVPQNKAYLNRTSEQAAEALEFNVTPAGIDELAAPETLETEYYDLQGRRVLYPANGIFVTGSGRKVFIK